MFKLKIFKKKKKDANGSADMRSLIKTRKRAGKELRKRKRKVFLKELYKLLLRNRIFRYSFLLIIISCGTLALRYLLLSSHFDIKEISVEGVSHLSDEQIKEALSYLEGKNIFFIRSSSVKTEAELISPYIGSVRVEKFLPSKITIYIEEREPRFLWVNLAGIYLVDKDGLVLELISDYDNLEISEEDLDLLMGYGDLTKLEDEEKTSEKKKDEDEENSEEGENEKGKEEEEEEEEEKNELSEQEKYDLISEEKMEIALRVDQFWSKNVKIDKKKYKNYPQVYSYDLRDLKVLDRIDESFAKSTIIGLEIDFVEKDIMRYIWESEFRFVIYLKRNRRIVFSTRREFTLQVEDLEILLEKLKVEGKEFSSIDLSSEVIVYEIE